MRELAEQLRAQLWIVIHHRYVALITAVIICCIGWVSIEFIPDKYQAETKVYLDTQSVLKTLLQGLTLADNMREQSAEVMQRTLITRPNMQKVILETDINLHINGPKETERMVVGLMEDIEINSVSLLKERNNSSNLYRISYANQDPELAKDVIVVLLNIFVESILGQSRKDAQDAGEFLDDQIGEYQKRQYEAEERLKLFKQQNLGVMPEEGRTQYQKIVELDSKIEVTDLSLVETENRIVELKRQIKLLVTSASGLNTETGNMLPHPLDIRIAEMEKKLDELKLQYTENHPDVVNTKLALEQLRQRKEENQQQVSGNTEKTVDSNVLSLPLYQDLNVLLSEAQSEAVALRTRANRYEQQRAEKGGLLKTLSEVEAELANLNRDYSINKKMYEDLVIRRESSNLSAKADQTGDKLQFKIIEPPRTPLIPVSPNRILLTTVVLLLALGGGFGIAILFEQLNPTFYTRSQLSESMDIPVIGSVSMF
ncbi:MAG: polysaccharide chain length determinant protein (PEP-CTERM system associated), partial [Planctomycetota bacterium]